MLQRLKRAGEAHRATNLRFQNPILKTFVGAAIGALLGSILWLFLPGVSVSWSDLWSSAGFGALFGLWVGLVSCGCLSLLAKVRDYQGRSVFRTIAAFLVVGSLAGGVVFFPFGDGLRMAVGLGMEGAILGGLIAAVLALLSYLVYKHNRPF